MTPVAENAYHVHMAKRVRPEGDPANTWPRRLFEMRQRLGLTQQQAAAKVRVSRRAWVKWESGRQVPSASRQLLLGLLEDGKL